MSLTSILKSNYGKEIIACIGNIKSFLVIDSPHEQSWGAQPLVPPIRSEGWYAALVGTAWDYWISLWLLQHHKGLEGITIAEQALQKFSVKMTNLPGHLVLDLLNFHNCSDDEKMMIEEDVDPVELKKALAVYQLIINAKNRRLAVIAGNLDVFSEEVIEDAVILARMNLVFRSHKVKWQEPDATTKRDVISELRAMIELFLLTPERFGSVTKPIWSNPTFGEASDFVGGADADIVVGNCLWDFKTTKHFEYDTNNWAQLLGYYVLSEWGKSPFQINQIGLYYARFGTQVTININDLKEIVDIKKFKTKLFNAVCQRIDEDSLFRPLKQRKTKEFRFEFVSDELISDTQSKNLKKVNDRIECAREYLEKRKFVNDFLETKKELKEFTKRAWEKCKR